MRRAPSDVPEHDRGQELLRRLTFDRRRLLRRALACAAVVAIVVPLWVVHKQRVQAFVNGESDLDGNPRYEPPHPIDRQALARIDFEQVHERLIPTWTIALAHATNDERRQSAELAFEELEREVSPDPNLRLLLSSVHRALRDDPVANAARVDYSLWAYNRYLDREGIPWRIEASLVLGAQRPTFRTMTYEVLADAHTPEGHRLRLLRRGDRTNTVEGWLGHTPRAGDGALVVMGRVLHFTVRHVWPALDPALDARRPDEERPWLGHVREEVRAALEPSSFELLAETAADQQALIEVAASIEARQLCGSEFRVYELPYNGLSNRSRRALQLALVRSQRRPSCPEVTLDEAARIVGASERLGSTDGLENAVERLTMIIARSVAVHELQHVADGPNVACHGCPDGLDGLARAEVSAYVSAFSTEGLGYLALLQACATPRGQSEGGAALQGVLDALLPHGCGGPTRDDLYAIAGHVERELFGRRAAVTLPSLPARVTLLPRPARAERVRARPLEGGWGLAISAN